MASNAFAIGRFKVVRARNATAKANDNDFGFKMGLFTRIDSLLSYYLIDGKTFSEREKFPCWRRVLN